MNIKAFAFILTLMLLLFGAYFLVQNFQTCYTCSTALASKAAQNGLEKPDVIFAMINFVVAIFSIYLITKRKFSTSAIISGVTAGLQVVAIGTLLFLAV